MDAHNKLYTQQTGYNFFVSSYAFLALTTAVYFRLCSLACSLQSVRCLFHSLSSPNIGRASCCLLSLCLFFKASHFFQLVARSVHAGHVTEILVLVFQYTNTCIVWNATLTTRRALRRKYFARSPANRVCRSFFCYFSFEMHHLLLLQLNIYRTYIATSERKSAYPFCISFVSRFVVICVTVAWSLRDFCRT